jgi:hypothetical protein
MLLAKEGEWKIVDLGLVHSSAAPSISQLIIERLVQAGDVECESAPKWDPFSSPGKHLISTREFVRGGVRIGADRDPCWWRDFSLRSATYAEISRVPLRC